MFTNLSYNKIDQFGSDAKSSLISFINTAHSISANKQYIPKLQDFKRSSRYIYYSVYSGTDKVSYYSHLNRVVVSFDRNPKKHNAPAQIRRNRVYIA